MTYRDGFDAAFAGEPVSSCPWSPTDPDGTEWRRGWIDGEGANRHRAGTFDHTPDEYAEYGARMGMDRQAKDPALAVLREAGWDVDREPPTPNRGFPSVNGIVVSFLHVSFSQQLDDAKAASDAFNKAMRDITATIHATLEANVFTELLKGVEPVVSAPDPSKRAFSCPRHGVQTTHGYCKLCSQPRTKARHK